jgi:hypothetical protein
MQNLRMGVHEPVLNRFFCHSVKPPLSSARPVTATILPGLSFASKHYCFFPGSKNEREKKKKGKKEREREKEKEKGKKKKRKRTCNFCRAVKLLIDG